MRKLLVFFLLLPFSLFAQRKLSNIQDTVINARLFTVNFGGQLPGADMAKRFGPSITAGASFLFKFGKNWLIGVEGYYLYGATVKDDSGIKNLATSTGYFIGTDGLPDNIVVTERGYMITGKFGKIVRAFGSNPNSGIMLLAGAGFIQHKIGIIDVGNTFPQLEGAYVKGYDQLTNGLLVTEFIGYSHLDKRRLINFYGGFEFMQGLTQNRRDWDFYLMQKDTEQRLDLLFGLKIGWMLPFYGKGLQQFYTD